MYCPSKNLLNLATLLALILPQVGFCSWGGRDSGGGTPFLNSGNQMQAIFQSDKIWTTVKGPLQKIEVLKTTGANIQYSVTTLENVSIFDTTGVFTLGSRQETCQVLVDLSNQSGGNSSGSIITVTNVDFTYCPSHLK